jgi:hypothetical protein
MLTDLARDKIVDDVSDLVCRWRDLGMHTSKISKPILAGPLRSWIGSLAGLETKCNSGPSGSRLVHSKRAAW